MRVFSIPISLMALSSAQNAPNPLDTIKSIDTRLRIYEENWNVLTAKTFSSWDTSAVKPLEVQKSYYTLIELGTEYINAPEKPNIKQAILGQLQSSFITAQVKYHQKLNIVDEVEFKKLKDALKGHTKAFRTNATISRLRSGIIVLRRRSIHRR